MMEPKVKRKKYVLENDSVVEVHKVFGDQYYLANVKINGRYPKKGDVAHNVGRHEYIFVISGKLLATINGIDYELKKGTSKLICDGDFYTFKGKAEVIVFVQDKKAGRTEIISGLDSSALYHPQNINAGTLYDQMTVSALEDKNYGAIIEEVVACAKKHNKTISVLDVGCGTAVIGERLFPQKNIVYTGIDVNKSFLEEAQKKLSKRKDFQLICKDIFDFKQDNKDPSDYEVIVLASVYHHFPRKKRVALLLLLKNLLANKGIIVIYEKVIPSYKNREEYRQACKDFYNKRIDYLHSHGYKLSLQQELDIRQLRDLSVLGKDPKSGEIEEKASFEEIEQDIEKANLKIKKIKKMDKIYRKKTEGDIILVVEKT